MTSSWPLSGRYAGLRIHECFRIDTATAERALRENASLSRARVARYGRCPSTSRSPSHEETAGSHAPGHKLLVPDDMHTDRAINLLQLFIMKHRDEVRDAGSDRPLTFHGLRHTYAAEKYKELTGSGMSAWTPISPCPGCWATSGRM